MIGKVEPKRVWCRPCSTWIQLGTKYEYLPSNWNMHKTSAKHKEACQRAVDDGGEENDGEEEEEGSVDLEERPPGDDSENQTHAQEPERNTSVMNVEVPDTVSVLDAQEGASDFVARTASARGTTRVTVQNPRAALHGGPSASSSELSVQVTYRSSNKAGGVQAHEDPNDAADRLATRNHAGSFAIDNDRDGTNGAGRAMGKRRRSSTDLGDDDDRPRTRGLDRDLVVRVRDGGERIRIVVVVEQPRSDS